MISKKIENFTREDEQRLVAEEFDCCRVGTSDPLFLLGGFNFNASASRASSRKKNSWVISGHKYQESNPRKRQVHWEIWADDA